MGTSKGRMGQKMFSAILVLDPTKFQNPPLIKNSTTANTSSQSYYILAQTISQKTAQTTP